MNDINDNSPAFKQSKFDISLRDPTAVGDFVFGTSALDADLGTNGTVTYSISGPSAAKFTIDQNTGETANPSSFLLQFQVLIFMVLSSYLYVMHQG